MISRSDEVLSTQWGGGTRTVLFVSSAKFGRPTLDAYGFVGKAIDDAGAAAGANGLNVALDAQLVSDIRSIASTVKSASPVAAAK